jgi:hypothetical protein
LKESFPQSGIEQERVRIECRLLRISHTRVACGTLAFVCESASSLSCADLGMYICLAERLWYALWRKTGLHQRNTMVGSTEVNCVAAPAGQQNRVEIGFIAAR